MSDDMTWTQAVDAVEDQTSKLPTIAVERLARMVPIMGDEEQGMVGAGLERVLRARYGSAWADESDARLLELSDFPGDTYPDRVARAKSDVMHAILEDRHPDVEPVDSWDDTAGITWREHLKAVYGI